jgi:hypothetical protein
MRERVLAPALLLVGALYLVTSLGFPFGTAERPGPGFFPVTVGAFLCVACAWFILTTFRARAAAVAVTPPTVLPAGARDRVVATIAGLLGFCLLVPWIGYPLAAFGFVALLLRRLGDGTWVAVVVAALVTAAASYYVFAVLLGVPLPRGIFLDW